MNMITRNRSIPYPCSQPSLYPLSQKTHPISTQYHLNKRSEGPLASASLLSKARSSWPLRCLAQNTTKIYPGIFLFDIFQYQLDTNFLHKNLLFINQTIPYACIALATFIKPAILAPST